jgi:hypothetical protein
MISTLISGLRSIRVSLITGGIILTGSYLFLYEHMLDELAIRPALQKVLTSAPAVPILLIILSSLILGSLYTTLLEGFVDGIHRKYINKTIHPKQSYIKRIIICALLPYSDSAKRRLIIEVTRFYKMHEPSQNASNEVGLSCFINSVLIEALWMEGKIAGTTLEQPYDKMRSEGDIRLSCGLLLPYAFSAVAYSLYASKIQIILALLGGLVIMIPMVNYGLYYFKKANSFLAHHIADGKVLSPSMQTLKKVSSKKGSIIKNSQSNFY